MKDFWNSINIFNKTFFLKPLKIHILWFCLILIFLIYIISYLLEIFTYHNEYIKLPNVLTKNTTEAINILKKSNVTPIISDSIYVENLSPNTVIKQTPDSFSIIKKNRNVFLVINRSAPNLIEFPNIINIDYKSAIEVIKSRGFYVYDTIYHDDLAKDLVINCLFQGREIKKGTKIPIGSGVAIILGNGKNGINLEYEWVPNLNGLTLDKAKNILESLKIKSNIKNQENKEAIINDAEFIIIDQFPNYIDDEGNKNKILQGNRIDILVKKIK